MVTWLKRLAAWFEKPRRPDAEPDWDARWRAGLAQIEADAAETCEQVIRGELDWQVDPPTKEDLSFRVYCHSYIQRVRGKR